MSPEINTFACDVCGAQKRECNRWWMLWITPDGQLGLIEFDPVAWEGFKALGFPRAIACGEEHVHELLSRYLVARSFDPPSGRPVSVAPASGRPSEASPDSSSTREENET